MSDLTSTCALWYDIPMDSTTHTTPTTHLQGIGTMPARPAADIKVGDTLIWNYGYESKVEAITPRGKTMITLHTSWVNHGTVCTGQRHHKLTSLLVVKETI
jgi:hypothetical protein